MLSFQGNKSKYAEDIEAIIKTRGGYLPFVDACCGSCCVTEQMSVTHTTVIDNGGWGQFWLNMLKLKRSNSLHKAEYLLSCQSPHYDVWVKSSLHGLVPQDPANFVIVFLALQGHTILGKPICMSGLQWKTPGLTLTTSYQKTMRSWRRAVRTIQFIGEVVTTSVDYFVASKPSNIYMDPDYEDTTGYEHSASWQSVLNNNRHCNIFVSHHVPLDFSWTEVFDISRENSRRNGSIREYVHYRKAIV